MSNKNVDKEPKKRKKVKLKKHFFRNLIDFFHFYTKNIYLGYGARIVLYLIILVVSFFLAYVSYNKFSFREATKFVAYSSASSIEYKVHLKDNTYYDTDTLPADMQYIASLIDYIDTNIKYNITASDAINYKYKYRIDAITKVYGDESRQKVLFEKTTPLVKEKTSTIDNKKLMLEENLKIKYEDFNNLIKSFKASYSLNSNSDVSIIMYVDVVGKNDEISEIIKLSDKVLLKVPLTEQTVNVNIEKSEPQNNNIVNKEQKLSIKENKLLIIPLGLCLIGLITIISMIIFLIKNKPKTSKYNKVLNKILKEYDAIIANSDYKIDESKYEIVRINSFEELRDVHDNTGNPILYTVIHKNQKSSFVLIKDNILYKYILKASDLEE